ncbi:MAG: hypothetical protein NT062_36150 [Proteobacteria bacterium]|nr:hypothetical protein [Pseudomonadota bacterium]
MLALGVMGGATGCHRNKGPTATLDVYGRALRNKDFRAAYELMSTSFRSKVSPEDYIRTMRENAREVDETAQRLNEGKRGTLEVSAEFEYGIGDQMRLVQEGGGWRIASNPLAFYEQSTPLGALRSFVRAYKLQRWDVMLRFVPNAYREKMDAPKMMAQFTGPSRENIELLMNALEQNLDEPVAVHGNEASMRYGDKFEVKFLKEDGVWKLKDLD